MTRTRTLMALSIGSVLLASGCSMQPADRAVTTSHAGRQVRCSGRVVHLATRIDNLDSTAACALVGQAIETLGRVDSTPALLLPADTARVSAVRLTAMTETDSLDRALASWWVVTLELADRDVNAEVRVDQRTRLATIRPVHR